MRIAVLADSANSAAGYAALLASLGHEPWTGVGGTPVVALVQEWAPA